jgi:hypothetical protein
MANMLSPDKEKITYAEWSDVRDELAVIRKELSLREGREIGEAEFIRIITLQQANKHLRAKGKPTLDLDPSATPGGKEMAPRRRRR